MKGTAGNWLMRIPTRIIALVLGLGTFMGMSIGGIANRKIPKWRFVVDERYTNAVVCEMGQRRRRIECNVGAKESVCILDHLHPLNLALRDLQTSTMNSPSCNQSLQRPVLYPVVALNGNSQA